MRARRNTAKKRGTHVVVHHLVERSRIPLAGAGAPLVGAVVAAVEDGVDRDEDEAGERDAAD